MRKPGGLTHANSQQGVKVSPPATTKAAISMLIMLVCLLNANAQAPPHSSTRQQLRVLAQLAPRCEHHSELEHSIKMAARCQLVENMVHLMHRRRPPIHTPRTSHQLHTTGIAIWAVPQSEITWEPAACETTLGVLVWDYLQHAIVTSSDIMQLIPAYMGGIRR